MAHFCIKLSLMLERRSCERKPFDVYFNKFLDGYPYLCRGVDVSEKGILVETFAEPNVDAERFPLELRLPEDDETLWLWARRVRRDGTRQALEFVSISPPAQRKLNDLLSKLS